MVAMKRRKLKQVPTLQLDLGEPGTCRLILSKDIEEIDTILGTLKRRDLIKTQFLAQVPDLRTGLLVSIKASQETPLDVKCGLCREPLYCWRNDWQQGLHCGCTMWVGGLDVDRAEVIGRQAWV